MKAKRGSMVGLTTVRSSPKREPMACQYASDAPPSGSTAQRTRALRMASRSTTLGGGGRGVGVLAQQQRGGDPLAGSVLAGGLGDGQDVRLVERAGQRRAAMPAGPEADQLFGLGRIGRLVVAGDEAIDVHEQRR